MPLDHLILIPTAFESGLVKAQLANVTRRGEIAQFHCGFGPIAAAAVTAELIATYRPAQISLVGIAGAYRVTQSHGQSHGQSHDGEAHHSPPGDPHGRPPLEIGHAYQFSTVTVDGVGVGRGGQFRSAGDLKWQQFAGDEHRAAIGDEIEIDGIEGHEGHDLKPASGTAGSSTSPRPWSGRLLTVCAASDSPAQADQRRRRYQAIAEDMEGFAVAMACRLQSTPLRIIRGISNVAGDREKSNWKIVDAMGAAIELLETTLEPLT